MKLTRRKKILAAFLLVLAVLIGPYLFSRMLSPWRRVRVFSDNVEAVGHEGATLRVVCYNIAHGRGATDDNWEEFGEEKATQVTEIGKFLKETDADIVVLNEVDFCAVWSGHRNQAEAIARESGFPYRAEQRNLDFRLIYGSCKFGNAVLSRYPIVDAEVVNYPAQSSWEDWLAGSKRGVVCTIRLSPGRQIRVVAVHLEHRDETTRVASANMILDAVRSSEIPLIAAGDFNSTPTGFPHSQASPKGANAMDNLAASGLFRTRPQELPKAEELTYSSYQPRSVIDWILIPSQWKFGEYRSVDTLLSDHRPVVADVEME